MKKVIIDVSKWNAIMNFSLVKNNVDGVIVRAGFRGNTNAVLNIDSRFFPYMTELNKEGIDLGAYFITAAVTEDEAREEARFFINLIKQTEIKLNFPVFICSELTATTHDGRSDNLFNNDRTSIVKAFIEECKLFGYQCGIYAKSSWLSNKLNMTELSDVPLWIVKDSNESFNNVLLTRETDKCEIKGIAGNVCKNIMIIPEPEPVKEEPKKNTIKKIVKKKEEPVKEEKKIVEKPKKEKKAKVYKIGASIKLKDAELYKTSVSSTILQNLTGKFYIANDRVLNGRIRVSESKDGETIGWIQL